MKVQEQKIAIAKGMQLNVSPKASNEICYTIKGMKTARAIKYLENVKEKKEFVPYRKYHKKVAHRAGGTPGRYPVKAAGLVLKILKNAVKNAEFKGLDAGKLKIFHANAYKTLTLDRMKPKGRAKPHRIDLTNIEIGVKEL